MTCDDGRWRSRYDLLIDPLDSWNDYARRIADRSLVTGYTHLVTSSRIREQLLNACPQRENVAWWHEDAGRAVHNEVWQSTNRRCNHWPASRHRLESDSRTRIRPAGGHNCQDAIPPCSQHVIMRNVLCDDHTVRNIELLVWVRQPNKHQRDGRTNSPPSLEQNVDAFVRAKRSSVHKKVTRPGHECGPSRVNNLKVVIGQKWWDYVKGTLTSSSQRGTSSCYRGAHGNVAVHPLAQASSHS